MKMASVVLLLALGTPPALATQNPYDPCNPTAGAIDGIYCGLGWGCDVCQDGTWINCGYDGNFFATGAEFYQYEQAHPCGCYPPPSDMVAWYTLDEGTAATVGDIAGANDVGTVNGAISTAGMVDGAYHFAGGSDRIDIAATSGELDFAVGNLSLDAWVKTTGSGLQTIFDKRTSSPVGYSFFLSDGAVAFQLADRDVGNCTCGPDPSRNCTNWSAPSGNAADGTWHHVAVTVVRYETDGGKFYLDGVQVGTFDPTIRDQSISNSAHALLGARPANACAAAASFDGDIDEVEIFSRALDPTEVAAIYNAGANGKCKPQDPYDPVSVPMMSGRGLLVLFGLLLVGAYGKRRGMATGRPE